ncbi:hypothetical protein [Quadrisphaera granulorum]|nr:hypothetical protein [Quadrisphaera granulorum]
MLHDALTDEGSLEVSTFSWSTALFGSYDVLHLHWPENLAQGHSPLKSLVREALTGLLCARLLLRRTAVVRTVHNLEVPSEATRHQRLLLAALDKLTTLRIALNTVTPAAEGELWELIPHGHYRGWMARYEEPPSVPGRIAYAGMIRRYKNVEHLIQVFSQVPGPLTLRVAGAPSTAQLRSSLESLAADDPRVQLRLEHVSDAELAIVIGESELVVLPYSHMHNSGSALMALSLDRPVLVPAGEVNELLAREVGPGWVHQYAGTLTPAALAAAVNTAAGSHRGSSPDLSAREWVPAADAHARAYRRAVAARRGRRYSS